MPDPEVALRKMLNVRGLYNVLGNAMLEFAKAKHTAFPNATLSKEDFWQVPRYKFALASVFLIRHLLGSTSHRQWYNFSEKDYKLNTRTFKRWIKNERAIMEASELYQKMPDKCDPEAKGRKKVKYKSKRALTGSTTESPRKKVFIVGDDTTSDEDDDGDDDL
jgi:hypothetical protein